MEMTGQGELSRAAECGEEVDKEACLSEIKKYIEDYYLQNRQSPSTTKIAEAVGIARGTAYKYLVEMAEKNMIEYNGQEIRTNVTRQYSGEQTQTPIVGSIPCGSPQYEEENIEEYVSLPSLILPFPEEIKSLPAYPDF